jgi:predicted aldo/keto reductase-like oxidoreductase
LGVFDGYFPLGLGTSRFPISGPNDRAGIDKSIALVRRALDAGINYIDTAYTYSAGMAQTVLKEAFAQTDKPFGVTVKVMRDMDKSADDARRRTELQLKAMGLEKAAFFTCWTIFSFDIFMEIMKKGGVYEGAQKLKDKGIIDHICFSTHANPPDIIKIIESGAFEGITLSYNLTNALIMRPVLDAAHKNNIDVAAMNPLGGGIIPQNPDFFKFALAPCDDSVAQAAMRFVKAHPAVKIVLSGLGSETEISENIGAFADQNTEPDTERLNRVLGSVSSLPTFCTGCKYCGGCPEGIPISEMMTQRNALLFGSKETYNRTEPELVKNIQLFHVHTSLSDGHFNTNGWFPNSSENPCTQCGQCEAKCTQKLSIIDSVADMFERAEKVGFSLAARKKRLHGLLVDKGLTRVGLYPNGGFANLIVELYRQFFAKPEFEWLQFNSDPKMWGETSGGLSVHSPDEIIELKPDIIIVCTYKYDKEIFEGLKHYETKGIKIVKLHRDTDVPWVF